MTEPARATPPEPTAAAAQAGPLFPETEPTGGTTVRAAQPSAGEAGSSTDPMLQMAAHERARAMPQKSATKGNQRTPPDAARGPQRDQHKTPETKVAINKRIADFPGQSYIERPTQSVFC